MRNRSRQLEALEEAHIPVVDAWRTADRTRCVADRSRREPWRSCNCDWVKRQSTMFSGIPLHQRARCVSGRPVRLAGRLEKRAQELFDVVRRSDADRKAGLEGHNARYLPTIQQLSFESIELRHGQRPHIAENKSVARIEQRRGPYVELKFTGFNDSQTSKHCRGICCRCTRRRIADHAKSAFRDSTCSEL